MVGEGYIAILTNNRITVNGYLSPKNDQFTKVNNHF